MIYRSEYTEREREAGSGHLDEVRLAVACDWGTPGAAPSAAADRDVERRASRRAARRAVSRVTGLRADTVELRPEAPRGIPGVAFPAAAGRVLLSLTHSHGRSAAIALRGAAGVRGGIDLEREGAVRPEFARYFLTAAERGRAGERGLTELWALKEAAWKALRLDDSVHFTALELSFDDAGDVAGLSLHGRAMPARAALSRPWPGFVLAVVLVGDAA